MDPLLIVLFTILPACLCNTENGHKINVLCDGLKTQLESISVSIQIDKEGFHRQLITTVDISPDLLSDLRLLLVYKWPGGIYVDPYELASLSQGSDWQILSSSKIDLEVPAHKTLGFSSFVFTTNANIAFPIHGRYHEPSAGGESFVQIDIDAPEVLLRSSTCPQLGSAGPQNIVAAPCTADNSSTCSWFKMPLAQQGGASLQLPLGDSSATALVCGGTLLITGLCCAAVSTYVWKHRLTYT